MIGRLDFSKKEATVVGAGIAGLLIAYRLDELGFKVTLLEASTRAGGLIETRETQYGIAEAAAHSMLATPRIIEFLESLGVKTVEVKPDSRARYIYRRGKLRRFPLGLIETCSLILRAYWVWADRKRDPESIDLGSWGARHLGRGARDYLLSPMLRGIYASRPEELSVAAVFPALVIPKGHSLLSHLLNRWLAGRRVGQPRTRKKMISIEGGMGSLARALESRLHQKLGDRFKLGTPVARLPDGIPNLVLCLPAHAAAPLLTDEDPRLARSLSEIPYSPLVSVTAFAPLSGFARPPQGVGFLVPENERKRECLGILFNSSSFPGRTKSEEIASFTVMFGGSGNPAILAKSDDEIRKAAEFELRATLGLRAPLVHAEIFRWPRAIPQYGSQAQAAWELARQGWCAQTGHVIFSNISGQVSLRGMIETAIEIGN